jgi:sortase A
MKNNYIYTVYTKRPPNKIRLYLRFFGLILSLLGLGTLAFFSFPTLSSYAIFQAVYASDTFTAPIPRNGILNSHRIQKLLSSSPQDSEIDYTNARNWFPSFDINPIAPRVNSYTISIPKLGIEKAIVSTTDYNVGIHLVNYGGTAVPPDRGNAVIFGHSTLPQLFNPKDYKTIFAKLYQLKRGDNIYVFVGSDAYTYTVTGIAVVTPDDFSPLMQEYDASYLTLITCWPPGTTIDRLIVKSILKDNLK